MRTILITLIIMATSLMGACTAYRIDIRQGNFLEQKQLEQLKTGMNKRQVIFLLGTPLIRDPFHQDRWDYVYTLKPGTGKPGTGILVGRRLTLIFEGNRLVKIDDSQLEQRTLDTNNSDS